MKKAILICGATASGKTKIAVQLAQKLKTQIISADSVQVYKNLDIGAAKPTAEEQRQAKHHLIDIVSPFDNFSVAEYKNLCNNCLNTHFQDKIPIICGGTGLYFNSLIYNFDFSNVYCDENLRAELDAYANQHGNEALWGKLNEIDPETAQNLHFNQRKRIIRAIEIYQLSGKKKSENEKYERSDLQYLLIGLQIPREELYKRIDSRVDEMFQNGLLEEVQSLQKLGLNKNHQSMQAIGYKETLEFLENKIYMADMIEKIKQNSRNYAKRQITFFKKLPRIVWLENDENTAEKILQLYENK